MPLVASRSLFRLTGYARKWAIPAHIVAGRRVGGYKHISVQSTPSTDATRIDIGSKSTSVSSPDATFEVLGAPYSLLSVTLSPSQELYTRRGTLIGVNGDPDNTVSSLRLLNPTSRLPLGIPFLYQKLTSTTPTSILIAPKSPINSLAILQLDGTTDWKLAQRKALVAWTGKSLTISPTINTSLTMAHWSNSNVTGRGLLALSGRGQVYTIDLAKGETYIAHPAHILAYSTTSTPKPTPYRFKSSQLKLSIPLSLGNWFPSSKFVRDMKNSRTYRAISRFFLGLRTWSRRTFWGDRLFLRFEGPSTLLLQTRGSNIREILTSREINEIADHPAGSVHDVLYDMRTKRDDKSRMGVQGGMTSAATTKSDEVKGSIGKEDQPKLKVTGVEDGTVKFEAVTKS